MDLDFHLTAYIDVHQEYFLKHLGFGKKIAPALIDSMLAHCTAPGQGTKYIIASAKNK